MRSPVTAIRSGPERVGPLDDGPRPRCRKQAADVQVGQLQDRVAVEARRQVCDRDLDVLQRRHARGLPHRDRREQDRRESFRVAPSRRDRPGAGRQHHRASDDEVRG